MGALDHTVRASMSTDLFNYYMHAHIHVYTYLCDMQSECKGWFTVPYNE